MHIIFDFINLVGEYIAFSIDNVMSRSPFEIVFLFGPALLFDTTRYYIGNSIILFLEIFGSEKKDEESSLEYKPFVSVILPVYNEGIRLKNTINSFLENDYPNFEIIVVDDKSEDNTPEICRNFESKGLIKFFRKTERGGKPSAINYGLNFSKGEIIMGFDGDTLVHRNAISEAVKPFRDKRVGVVSGNLKVYNDKENLVTRLQAAEYGMCISISRRWLAFTDLLQIASGAFSSYRREVMTDLKGADPETGEDLDLTIKTRKLGFKVAFAPKAIALTEVPDTWIRLAKQRIRWDRCYVSINLRKHRNLLDFHSFKIGDFIAGVLDLFFNLVLLFIFPLYFILIAIFFPQIFPFIVIVTLLYYTIMNFIQFTIVALLSDDPGRDWVFVLYSPIFFFYSLFLRAVSMFAYLLEFFRMSFLRSNYLPKKVWDNRPEYR